MALCPILRWLYTFLRRPPADRPDAGQVTGQQDCGSGTTVTDDITLIVTTSCTISWKLYRPVQGTGCMFDTPEEASGFGHVG